MKKTNIKTWLMLVSMIFGLYQLANAQFRSSDSVFCYQYYKTVDNGVISKKEGDPYVYFFCFYGEKAGYRGGRTLDVARKLSSEPDFYSSAAINDAHRGCGSMLVFGDIITLSCYKIDLNLTTSTKITYRKWESGGKNHEPRPDGTFYEYTVPEGWNTKPGEDWCISFSRDKSEMIQWSYSNPNKRDYYKLVDPKTLKPNLDFLD